MESVELFAHVAALESSRQRLVAQLDHSEIRGRYEEARSNYAQLEATLAGLEAEVQGLRNDESSLEAEASTLRHKLLSLQHAASSVSGVEYRSAEAMAHEISIVEERVGGLEAEALERLVTLESAEERLEGLRQELETATVDLRDRKEEWRGAEQELNDELERLDLAISSAVEELAPASREFYQRLSRKTSGVVFTMLTDGRCEYCNSTLSVFEVDTVRSTNAESDLSRRSRCSECGRILLMK